MNKMIVFSIMACLVVCGCTTTPEGGICCDKCSDPNSILIKAPGADCQCYSKCASNLPHFLQEVAGENCCTGQECEASSSSSTTTTTLPGCAVVGNVCTGSCPSGQSCMDTGPAIEYPYAPTCGCATDCSYIDDYKMCRNGACPPGLICAGTIQGLCSCQQAVY